MKSKLGISSTLELPLDAVTQTFAILGIRGSGKTNTGVVMAEELLRQGQQVVIIDPVDVWWGLKSGRSGKDAGFPIPVLGGNHADIPLQPEDGAKIADFASDRRVSMILSLRNLAMGEQRRFATDFARRLYERKGKSPSPLMLIVDEADEFVPQRIPKGQESMFGAFDRIVRRGRAAGLGVTLISQRAQVINKDVLSQAETLVAMRVLHKLDRASLEAWIQAHDTEGRREEFLGSLASLGRGEAWIWSPAWLGVFERVKIRERSTFDSSATPKAGEVQAAPREAAKVDIDSLRQALSDSLAKAAADDPGELRKKIAALEKQLRVGAAGQAQGASDELRRSLERDAGRERDRLVGRVRRSMEQANAKINRIRQALDADPLAELRELLASIASSADTEREAPARSAPLPMPVRSAPVPPANGAGSGEKIPVGELTILTAIAQTRGGADRVQLTLLTGYKRSTRDAYVQRLSQRSWIRIEGDRIHATEAGLEALGDRFEPLPEGRELREHWLRTLPEGESRILRIALDAYPDPVGRPEIDKLTGYARSSRDAYIQRLAGRKLIESAGSGMVIASKGFF